MKPEVHASDMFIACLLTDMLESWHDLTVLVPFALIKLKLGVFLIAAKSV